MIDTLKKAAQTVQNVLNEHKLDCKVLELNSSTRTAIEAATTIGCKLEQIAKSLVFRSKSGHPIFIIASGPNRINEKLIASYIGEKIEKADADFTKTITGFAIGGIPPIGHTQKIDEIFIDEDLMQYDDLWAAAGTPNAVFNIKTKDLATITKGKIIAIK
jgi:prolyl-tRNA editing enzyme YbaK/EbsC (Cys-tRNA(Pro) deacylase)